jgi:hypothetical protein
MRWRCCGCERGEFSAPPANRDGGIAMRITGLRTEAVVDGRPGRRRLVWSHLRATSRRCQPSSVAGSPRRPHPTGARGSSWTMPPAIAGRPADSGAGRPGAAAPRSRAALPEVRQHWMPHPWPAPSGNSAGSAQAGRRTRRSPRDDPSPPRPSKPDPIIEPHLLLLRVEASFELRICPLNSSHRFICCPGAVWRSCALDVPC